MPATLPTNIAPNTLYNNLNVRGIVSELNGSSTQWNNAYITLFGSEYIQLGTNFNALPSGGGTITNVSINSRGDRIAVGFNTPTTTAGITRIYEWNGLSWGQIGADIIGEAANDQSGWSVSLNAVGDRVAIGAPLNDGVAKTDSGHVRVYRFDGTNWAKLGAVNVDVDGEFTGDQSGWSVSLNAIGDRVAVGAIYNDGTTGTSADNRGSVRIYQWNETTWTQMGTVDLDGEAAGDQNGWSVSLNSVGDRLAVGANLNDGGARVDSGSVRVYQWDGTVWTQMGIDLDGEAAGDQNGYCVALNSAGDRIAISAINNDGTTGLTADNRGSVRVYQWNGTAWIQMGVDLDGEFPGDQSGISIALNAVGDRLITGSRLNDSGTTNSGHIRIYQWDGSAWVKFRDIDGITANDYIGTNLAINAVGDVICSNSFDSVNVFTNSSRVLSEKWNNNATGRTIFVDAITGNDSRFNTTAYNEHRPFASIAAAVAASTTGDTIIVRAGSYTIASSISLNSKGHLYFDPGTTVSVATGVVAFSYSQNNTAIYIKGHADFVLTGSAGVLTMPSGNAATAVAFECNTISGPSNVSGTLFNCPVGVLSVDAKVIQMNATPPFTASSATVFNVTGSGKVTTRIPFVYCGVFVNGTGSENPGLATGAQINADIWTLITYNTTAGMTLNRIGTQFNIVNYNHTGVGAALSWTENTTTESHLFRGITWRSVAGLSHITFASTAGTSNKIIRLLQSNRMTEATTNSLSSNVPINVGTHNTFAAVAATANITFKVGSFTVDTDVNTY